jgi:PKHD-type hydroxylase|tara:strand:+ start:1210 stop:1806 length:597 start_codon:yes stop_codon:yes gene_type:complete
MILKNYYWLSTNPFYKGFADDIKKEGLKQRQTDGLIGDHGKNVKKKSVRKSKISWIKSPLLYNNINPLIHEANRAAGWFFQWDWNETAQFTEYKKGQFYSWHRDAGSDPYPQTHDVNYRGKTRKMSTIILLSEPGKDFKGGELEMDFDSCCGKGIQIIDQLKKGSIITFPSFVRHRVKPVTKGIRHSLVLWHLGFPFC